MEAAGEQLFHDAFRASPVGIALENLDGQPVFVNQALCSFLGFSEEEMLGKHCVDFSPPEDAQKDWTLFEQLRAGLIDHYSLEKRFFKRDGSVIWGHLNIALLNHGGSRIAVAMVVDITDKRRAQETLELATKKVVAVARCNREFRYLWVNQGLADLLECPQEEIVGRSIRDVLGADAFETLLPHFERVLAGETVSYEDEVNYRNAGRKWVSATYLPTRDAAGVTDGWVAIIFDITEHKRAQEALAGLSGRLIQAQEEERTRIARDLHDDINQRVALIAVRLDSLRSNPSLSIEVLQELGDVTEQLADLGLDVQALSHRLHSPKLAYLGLAAAASGLCTEVSSRSKVRIDFQADNVPRHLAKEISLCLFRVLQEALQNAIKHSGSTEFSVSLTNGSKEVELTVHDSGRGFDVDEALTHGGIGLLTMQERLKSVNGTLSIESGSCRGTTIRARVPLLPKGKSVEAAD